MTRDTGLYLIKGDMWMVGLDGRHPGGHLDSTVRRGAGNVAGVCLLKVRWPFGFG